MLLVKREGLLLHSTTNSSTEVTTTPWSGWYVWSCIYYRLSAYALLQLTVYNVLFPMQINYKRLKLLQHPLVKEYLFYKFCRVALPVFLAHLLLYCIFLVLLTSFAMVSPRPGPDSKTCKNYLHWWHVHHWHWFHNACRSWRESKQNK